MERPFHAFSVAGVIGFDVVRYRGADSGCVIGSLVGLRMSWKVEGEKQAEGKYWDKAFHDPCSAELQRFRHVDYDSIAAREKYTKVHG
jgi:hypothetical protein